MTIFEKIVAGDLPCHKVWENEKYLAFLDIRPVTSGHTLVIPKWRVDPITELSESDFQEFWGAAFQVAKKLESFLPCERVCMAVVGFEVPHAHIHLIPAKSLRDFPWPGGQEAPSDELAELAGRLRAG